MHEFKSVYLQPLAATSLILLFLFLFLIVVVDAQMRSSPLPGWFALPLIMPGSLTLLPRLWAILLRNSSAEFVAQSTAVDFLETIEALIVSSATSPVVRNRLLRVLGDVVYNHSTREPCHSF
jgi:hypothetical protein